MGSSAYSSGESCEIRDENLRTIRPREMSSEGLGLFNFSVFKSTLSWEGGWKKHRETPPPSCKAHVLSHAFLSFRFQLSPILMELKPNKSSFYSFFPSAPLNNYYKQSLIRKKSVWALSGEGFLFWPLWISGSWFQFSDVSILFKYPTLSISQDSLTWNSVEIISE